MAESGTVAAPPGAYRTPQSGPGKPVWAGTHLSLQPLLIEGQHAEAVQGPGWPMELGKDEGPRGPPSPDPALILTDALGPGNQRGMSQAHPGALLSPRPSGAEGCTLKQPACPGGREGFLGKAVARLGARELELGRGGGSRCWVGKNHKASISQKAQRPVKTGCR